MICGAGIGGLALTQRLDAIGWDVVVLERSPGPRTQGYMIDFFGPGFDAAEAMGVLPRLHEVGYVVTKMTYRDEEGRRRSGLGFDQFAKVVDGRLISIMRPDLERSLREYLSDRVDLRYGAALTGVENHPDGVRVTVGGDTLEADLLVGADGIHSTVRGLVFGEERDFLRHLGFHTAAWIFTDPEVRADAVKPRQQITIFPGLFSRSKERVRTRHASAVGGSERDCGTVWACPTNSPASRFPRPWPRRSPPSRRARFCAISSSGAIARLAAASAPAACPSGGRSRSARTATPSPPPSTT
ncbi:MULTISPECIES: FAD-dependent monooxygenase [unclassified Nonomuraea]|uniref:FAD-dependent monooxygenase n=1 Tax=unclassified Nonomuraea TaxID=2593643 RepID=UPI0033DA158E